MQQKIQFIATLLHDPELIIMDEPFSGLDPVNAVLLQDTLLELKKQGNAVLFSTHRMDQVEKLCDSICLIDKGAAVLAGRDAGGEVALRAQSGDCAVRGQRTGFCSIRRLRNTRTMRGMRRSS